MSKLTDLGYNQFLERSRFQDPLSTPDMEGAGATSTSGSVTSSSGSATGAITPGEQERATPSGSVTLDQTTLGVAEPNEDRQSSNFVTGSTGWIIKGNGDVEFNNGTFRGSLVAGSIHIPDQDTTANSFHVDTTGLLWIGATETNKASAPVRISPAGEMTLGDPTTTHLQLSGPNVRIRSSNYVAGVSGFTVEPDLIEAENLVARGILKGATFQYDVVSAVGGQMIVSNADTLDADMTALDASTLTTKGTTTWAVNDMLLIQATTASGIQTEYLRITNIGSAPVYAVTRDLAAAYGADANPVWQKGTTISKIGTSNGDATYSGGWLRIFGEGTNSPYYSVYSRTGVAYNAYSERVRMGNLNGIGGKVADCYGIFIGDYSGGKYLIYDDVSGDLILNGYAVETDVYKLLGQTTLEEAAASISVSSFAAKSVLRIIISIVGFAATDFPKIQFNSDSGNNYIWEMTTTASNSDNHTNTANTSSIYLGDSNSDSSTYSQYIVLDVQNIATSVKNVITTGCSGAGGANSVIIQGAGVWNNTANSITTVTVTGVGGQNLLTGTNVKVFGI